ncbi:hypothetical protein [Aeromonas sp. MrichA-1]|uniref:hypothetical protein n=1 Tax=Aeromonas sp. MrichA-1 TaxID=2823362 RepID=UPI001B31C43D|nr:hypothetical protein [Aeromonas sp. MrichA-1]MBP4081363.1 hypothetical protein [Aeromonas sp. MrichA-1]
MNECFERLVAGVLIPDGADMTARSVADLYPHMLNPIRAKLTFGVFDFTMGSAVSHKGSPYFLVESKIDLESVGLAGCKMSPRSANKTIRSFFAESAIKHGGLVRYSDVPAIINGVETYSVELLIPMSDQNIELMMNGRFAKKFIHSVAAEKGDLQRNYRDVPQSKVGHVQHSRAVVGASVRNAIRAMSGDK